jgi:hypothetical protein
MKREEQLKLKLKEILTILNCRNVMLVKDRVSLKRHLNMEQSLQNLKCNLKWQMKNKDLVVLRKLKIF